MPVRGFFSNSHVTFGKPVGPHAPSPVPYVIGWVHLLQLNLRVVVTFLIDTAADASILNPSDSLRILTPRQIRNLGKGVPFGGAGGNRDHFPTGAVLSFIQDGGELKSIVLDELYVAEPGPHNRETESLLGRDVLSHFIMTFDQGTRTVTLGG